MNTTELVKLLLKLDIDMPSLIQTYMDAFDGHENVLALLDETSLLENTSVSRMKEELQDRGFVVVDESDEEEYIKERCADLGWSILESDHTHDIEESIKEAISMLENLSFIQ